MKLKHIIPFIPSQVLDHGGYNVISDTTTMTTVHVSKMVSNVVVTEGPQEALVEDSPKRRSFWHASMRLPTDCPAPGCTSLFERQS